MKKCFALLTLLAFTACAPNPEDYHHYSSLGTYSVFLIDGCEYVGNTHCITHKANCTNEAHGAVAKTRIVGVITNITWVVTNNLYYIP